MYRMLIPSAIFVAVAFASASATIINIPDDYPTIQQGIDASTDGDTVLVQPGTYVENINFNGHNVVLGSLFLTTEDPSYVTATVIDGDSSASVVSFESEEDSTAIITGFTIRNGLADFGGGIFCDSASPIIYFNVIKENQASSGFMSSGHGGGIYCRDSNAKILNNFILMNSSNCSSNYGGYGGGIYCKNCDILISDNTIIANNADHPFGGGYGGGIYCEGSSVVINNNVIRQNLGRGAGGGIKISSSDGKISNNTISDNSVGWGTILGNGGGIYCGGSSPIISNNIIEGNVANRYKGGGICIAMWAHPIIVNNIIVGNSAEYGGGIYNLGSSASIINTIIWGNVAEQDSQVYDEVSSITYCNIQGGRGGEGNIDADPLFIGRDGPFQLMSTSCGDPYDSPCIDAGHPNQLDSLLDCSWGLGDIRSDMGAYGGGDSTVHSDRVIIIPDDYPSIQEGIYVSRDGDTVLVHPGTYVENINFYGRNIVLGSLFITTNDTSFISATIIDGDSAGPVVVFETNENLSSTIAGFTIRNGYSYEGGGISCYYSNPTICYNRITGNTAWGGNGGGILCDRSNPNIVSNDVFGNYAHWGGGGIQCNDRSNAFIYQNIVASNSSLHRGGGFSCIGSHPRIFNNIIITNYSEDTGGGIYCEYSSPSIYNNNILENSAFDLGGGLSTWGSNPIVTNNNIRDNFAPFHCEIYVAVGLPQITYCNVGGGWEGEGNIDVNPLFRDPGNQDYHLMAMDCGDPSDSPCIDAGFPNIMDTLLDCSWGLGTIISDIGSFGGGGLYTNIDDYEPLIPKQVLLAQNYPNPFNTCTTIRFNLPQTMSISVEIYNVLGQKIAQLANGFRQIGQHKLIWNAANVPSGIYFARLKTEDSCESIKMILLK